ncbi:MAG: DUF5680 domain-containing protein [Minisyncoccales bacterium]
MQEKIFKEFLIKAKKETYANIKSKKKKLKDKSKELTFSEKDFIYRDRYFGGNPFSGEEVIFKKKTPIWIMNYYGKADSKISSIKIYNFLKKALSNINEEIPFRGPKKFNSEKWKYINKLKGTINFFQGKELIYFKNKLVYICYYHGGLL